MSKVQKHPTDEGKYQSTFDEYGHGKGNGKSRAAVYKHYAKINDSKKVEKEPKITTSENQATESLSDFTKSAKTEVEDEDYTKSAIYDEISCLENDTETVSSTIPTPI